MTIERPVLMSGPMVRALLAGRKSQTRRLPTPQWRAIAAGDVLWVRETWYPRPDPPGGAMFRADWKPPGTGIMAALTAGPMTVPWKSPLFMPRAMARILLQVTEVRIEPLQAITEADAKAEGVEPERDEHGVPIVIPPGDKPSPIEYVERSGNAMQDIRAALAYRPHYAAFWDTLHQKTGTKWHDNPEVAVVCFKPFEKAR